MGCYPQFLLKIAQTRRAIFDGAVDLGFGDGFADADVHGAFLMQMRMIVKHIFSAGRPAPAISPVSDTQHRPEFLQLLAQAAVLVTFVVLDAVIQAVQRLLRGFLLARF